MSETSSAPAAPRSPAEALDVLQAGNDRFVTGVVEHPNQDAARRAALAPSQQPFAVLFGCSDSRLAAEIIFDRGLGDMFVVRTAGHVMGPEVIGSIEYGVEVLGAPLVVVLGHDSCGAVGAARAALDGDMPTGGFIRDVVERVTPSVLAARAAGIEENEAIIEAHIKNTVDLLLDRSHMLAERVADGRAAVVGLYYQLHDGKARLVAQRGLPDAAVAGAGAASA